MDGLRVGELTHLLIEDVDFPQGIVHIRSKPELFWRVKTSRRRVLTLTEEMRGLFDRLIGSRRVGFVFLNELFFSGESQLTEQFASAKAFHEQLKSVAEEVLYQNPGVGSREQRRAVVAFCRGMGQIPEKRVRNEFMKLTQEIGCPEFTRAHDLRHLFSSRAQEQGMNPLLVQEILGHATLDMTRRYTHLGIDTKGEAIERLSQPLSVD
jgi:integrase